MTASGGQTPEKPVDVRFSAAYGEAKRALQALFDALPQSARGVVGEQMRSVQNRLSTLETVGGELLSEMDTLRAQVFPGQAMEAAPGPRGRDTLSGDPLRLWVERTDDEPGPN
jgi:hypothetical protein